MPQPGVRRVAMREARENTGGERVRDSQREQQRGDEKKQQRKPYGLLIILKPLLGLAM